jgi:hypothetical protein
VAVGRGLRDELCRQHGIGAGLVLDDDSLVPGFAQFLGEQAGDDVGRSAGRERHDQAHGLVRIVGGCVGLSLGQRGAGHEQAR